MKRNVGIDVLKILACVGVVVQHFGHSGGVIVYCVPVFMMLSMYLSGKIIENGCWCKVLSRLKRLYIPFAAWGIIYFIALSVMERSFSPLLLVQQLTIGVPVCPPLYFIFLLAVNTFLIFLICCGFKRCWRIALMLLMVGCFAAQYSELNYHVFESLSLHPRHAIGRFAELLPPAICGYWLYATKAKWIAAIIGIALWVLSESVDILPECVGYSYQGLRVMCGVFCFSTLAVFVGENCCSRLPDNCKTSAGSIAGLTAGIYYVHLLVGKSLETVIGRHRSLAEALIVFAVSAILAFVGKKIRKIAWLFT